MDLIFERMPATLELVAVAACLVPVSYTHLFAPSDTELLRALHSRNSKNIRNPLIFLQKMASYSCF